MCGIAAIFAYGGDAPPVDRDEVLRMREHMALRGPDGEGEWFSPDGRVGLGHRRLSIIDLSPGGAQPMFNADRSLGIIFNGEIYNYAELRSELAASGSLEPTARRANGLPSDGPGGFRGYQFRSNSDTEVILALYAKYSAKGQEQRMFEKLRGMYAFAIWDNQKRTMFVARDPFGIKPLYYSDNGHTIRVASQVKALRAGGAIDLAPDPAGHVGFFLWGHVPDPYTMFRNVRSLPAGHFLRVDRAGAHQPKCFCSISSILAEAEVRGHKSEVRGQGSEISAFQDFSVSAFQRDDLLRSALAETVKYHLVADVAVGVFLSSGLDSTVISALAAQQGGNLRTVTLGFEEYKGTTADEVPLAEQFAKRCGAQHQTIWISRADFEAERDHLFDAMDRPSVDGVNTFFVSLAAKQAGLKVALSGLGGDELFASYPSFGEIPWSTRFFGAFSHWRAFGAGVRALSAPLLKRFTSPKYAGIFEYGGTYSGAYLLRRGMFMPWELPDLLDPDFVKEGWAELQTLLRLDETLDGIRTPRLKISALEMSWYMRNQLLRDSDWAGMGHSVEIRVPLVDVDLLKQIGPLFAREPSLTKRDVAQASIPDLPSSVLNRPKTGFQVPVRDWLLSPYRYGTFRTHRQARARGLRGWTREVYSQFFPVNDRVDTFELRRRRPSARSTSSSRAELQILMLLSDGFGGFGGIAKFNRDFISALCSSTDVSGVVAVPRLMPADPGELPSKLSYLTDGLGGKRSYLRAVLAAARDMRFSKLPAVQAVIVCGHINLLPAAIAARRITGGDIYLIIHGIDAWAPTQNPVTNSCLRFVDDFISVSSVTRRRFLQWSGLRQDQGVVLPNCVDLNVFHPAPKSAELLSRYELSGKRVLLTLGRLASEERYKGFDEIIECLPAVGEVMPGVTYLVVGDGPDRLRLAEKAQSLGLKVEDRARTGPGTTAGPIDSPAGLGARVIFAGRIGEDVKADYMRLADLFVMPSSGEGFGIVLLEAMACGVPVIGSKIDGSREALQHGKLGRLVDPRNSAEIKTAVIESLEQPVDRTRRVPGIEYFSKARFEERVHEMLRGIRGTPLAASRMGDGSQDDTASYLEKERMASGGVVVNRTLKSDATGDGIADRADLCPKRS